MPEVGNFNDSSRKRTRGTGDSLVVVQDAPA